MEAQVVQLGAGPPRQVDRGVRGQGLERHQLHCRGRIDVICPDVPGGLPQASIDIEAKDAAQVRSRTLCDTHSLNVKVDTRGRAVDKIKRGAVLAIETKACRAMCDRREVLRHVVAARSIRIRHAKIGVVVVADVVSQGDLGVGACHGAVTIEPASIAAVNRVVVDLKLCGSDEGCLGTYAAVALGNNVVVNQHERVRVENVDAISGHTPNQQVPHRDSSCGCQIGQLHAVERAGPSLDLQPLQGDVIGSDSDGVEWICYVVQNDAVALKTVMPVASVSRQGDGMAVIGSGALNRDATGKGEGRVFVRDPYLAAVVGPRDRCSRRGSRYRASPEGRRHSPPSR